MDLSINNIINKIMFMIQPQQIKNEDEEEENIEIKEKKPRKKSQREIFELNKKNNSKK